jgi:predicted Rdx family selenoprotein
MKTDQIIVVSPQGWVQFCEGQSRAIKPWSDVQGPAIVVVDFAESQVGMQACKGKAEYAAAQIEKLVRSEGSIDGTLHVFVHRQVSHADSSVALYTAVSLELWQTFQTWASRQADHCLVVPVAGLLPGAVSGDELLVLRVGSQLHGYSASDNKMHYAGVAALGNEASDLYAPLRTLISQLRASGWKGSSKEVRWGSVFSDDLDAERALLSELSTAGLIDAKLLPHESLRSDKELRTATVLPHLLESTGTGAIQASWLSRMAWLSESYVMPLAAMITVVAVGLGAFAYFSQNLVGTQIQEAQALEGDIQALRQRVAAVAQSDASTKMAPASVEFVKQLGFAAVHDPIRMLGTVRRAAGTTVRVQSLQLVKSDASSAPYFRVDGVVIGGSNDDLRRFLSELRIQGWQARSAPPSDSALGAFAYDLKPVIAGKES